MADIDLETLEALENTKFIGGGSNSQKLFDKEVQRLKAELS